MPAGLELVIFDCDGVLVDSEGLAVEIDQRVLQMVGIELSRAQIIERFVGRSATVMDAMIEKRLGGPIPDALKDDWNRLYEDAFAARLTSIEGIEAALEQIELPVCVASSSTPETLRHKLELTGLRERFGGHHYSASQVAQGKPAPDLFLFAAKRMGVFPDRCAVVEDSPYGIEAAIAAGMRPFAYVGGLIPRKRLQIGNAILFDHMRELPSLLRTRDVEAASGC